MFHIAAVEPSQQDFWFTPADVGTWQHLVVVLDRGGSPNKVYIYQDGALASGYPQDLTVGADGQSNALYFGARVSFNSA